MMLLFQNQAMKDLKSLNVQKTSSLKIFKVHSQLEWVSVLYHQMISMPALEMSLSETFKWTTQSKVSTSSQIQETVEMESLRISYTRTFRCILQFGGLYGSVPSNNINQEVKFKVALWPIHWVICVILSQESLWETFISRISLQPIPSSQLVSSSVTALTHAPTSPLRT